MSNGLQLKYWLIWALSLGCVAIAKYITNESISLFFLYATPIGIWVMYLNFRKGRNLTAYLKQHHKIEWEHLTSNSTWGTEGAHSARLLSLVFSTDNLNDPEVSRLKENYKDIMLFVIVVFISIPLVFLYVTIF